MCQVIEDIDLYIEKVYEDYCSSLQKDGSVSREFLDAYRSDLELFVENQVKLFRASMRSLGYLRTMLDNSRVFWDEKARLRLLDLFDIWSSASKRAQWERIHLPQEENC